MRTEISAIGFAQLRSQTMKYFAWGIAAIILFYSRGYAYCQNVSPERGGIVFSFANPHVVTLDSGNYFSFDIQAAATGTGTLPRLGTGIVLVNFNNAVFGEFINTNHNVIITRGALLTTGIFPLYNIIVNDNQYNRLAVTFEYVSVAGYGNSMPSISTQLVNVKMKITGVGGNAGLSFAQIQMTGQQYQDDNATLFSPVIATDTLSSFIPTIPVNLSINLANNVIQLSWQAVPGCSYNVYSSIAPAGAIWQIEASGLTQTNWNCAIQTTRKFFYVTSSVNTFRR